MSIRGYCWNDYEHRRQAERDFERRGEYGRDREMYERNSWDECKRVYTEEFDRQVRAEHQREYEREEEQREQEARERRQAEARREEYREQEREHQRWLEQQAEEMQADEEEGSPP